MSLVTVAEFDRAMITDRLRRSHSLMNLVSGDHYDVNHSYLIAVANHPFYAVGIAKESAELTLIVTPDQYMVNPDFWGCILSEFDEFRRVDYVCNGVKCDKGEADTIFITLSSDNRPNLFNWIEFAIAKHSIIKP
ncbi:MAG: hypothetical protein ACRC47_16140 [Shewanella sp.]